MTAEQTSFEAALDPQLTRRLLRPLHQPGVIDRGLATTIQRRPERMISRSPLLDELTQRHGSVETSAEGQLPIVQPVLLPAAELASPADAERPRASAQPLPIVAPAALIAPAVVPSSTASAPPVVTPGHASGLIARMPEPTAAPASSARPATARVPRLPVVTPSADSSTIARAAVPVARPLVQATTPAIARAASVDSPAGPASPPSERALVRPIEPERSSAADQPMLSAALQPSPAMIQRVIEPRAAGTTTSGAASSTLEQPALPLVIARSTAGDERAPLISRAIESSVDEQAAPASAPPTATASGPSTPSQAAPIDSEALVESVLRKLTRQLAVEQERRGMQRWP